ncbi:MAG: matrixin family metalloprotease [Pseudomonadota bacterium]
MFFIDPDFTVTVGIASNSMFAQDMITPTANVVDTWNRKVPTTGNLDSNVVAFNEMDFESVLLHEMGHALGLGHSNLASESGLNGRAANFTDSAPGPDGVLNLDDGADNTVGSADDQRGDTSTSTTSASARTIRSTPCCRSGSTRRPTAVN